MDTRLSDNAPRTTVSPTVVPLSGNWPLRLTRRTG